MMVSLRSFGGFETGGTEEMAYAQSSVTPATTPAPPSANETYTVKIPQSTSGSGTYHDMYTDSFTHSNDMLYGFYTLFNNADSITSVEIFAAREGKSHKHFTLSLLNDILYLKDANGSAVDSISGFIVNDQWYRFEIRHTLHDSTGSVDVYIDGVLILSGSNEDFDGNGSTGKTEMYWKGIQDFGGFPPPTPPTEFWLSSWYYYNGGSASDFLGEYEIIGPYQDRRASAVSDFGDDLDANQWVDSGEVPVNDANYSQYTPALGVTREGGVTTDDTDGGATPGPYGDSRISSNTNIKGASWIMRTKGVSFLSILNQKYGKTPFGNEEIDNTSLYGLTPTGSWKNSRVFSESSTYVPSIYDYFQYGLKAQGNYGRISGAWCFILQNIPSVTVHIKGGDIKGATVL